MNWMNDGWEMNSLEILICENEILFVPIQSKKDVSFLKLIREHECMTTKTERRIDNDMFLFLRKINLSNFLIEDRGMQLSQLIRVIHYTLQI